MRSSQTADRRLLQILSLLSQPLPLDLLVIIQRAMERRDEFGDLAKLSVDKWHEHLQQLANEKAVRIFSDQHDDRCVRINPTRRVVIRDEFLSREGELARKIADTLFQLFLSDKKFKERRDTAVVGCLAGKVKEAFDARYSKYVRRGGLPLTRAVDRDNELEAVRMFFEDDWTKPNPELGEDAAAVLWHHVAICLRAQGQHQQADPLFQATLKQSLNTNNYRRASMCCNHMVVSFISQCRMADALVHALAASKLADEERKAENRRSTRGQSAIGSVLFKSGLVGEAQKVFEADKLLSVPGDAIAAWRKCTWLSVSGNHKTARSLAHKATIGFAAKNREQPELGYCLLALAKVAAESHFDPSAYDRYKREVDDAVNGLEQIGLLDDLAHSLLQRAALALRAGHVSAVVEADIAQAERVVADTGFRNLVMESRLLQCELSIRQKCANQAKQFLSEYESLQDETTQVFAPHVSSLSTWLDERFVNCCRPGRRLCYRATIADKNLIRQILNSHS